MGTSGKVWRRLKSRAKPVGLRLFHRIAGLPSSLRRHHRRLAGNPAAQVRLFYATDYWHWRGPRDAIETITAILLVVPVVVTLAMIGVSRNGALVAALAGRPIHLQLADQLRLFVCAGVMPPWYYVFELYRRPEKHHARGFISRTESKAGVMALLKKRAAPTSIVSDKVAFAGACARGFGRSR